jgi:hypothetical protein
MKTCLKNIIYSILPVVFLFISFYSKGQIINNSILGIIKNENFFNEKFIRENGIVSISARISEKRDLKAITDQGVIEKFSFNNSGKITEHIKTFKLKEEIIDTSLTGYQYNDVNKLIIKSGKESKGYYSYEFKYNPSGKIVQQQYKRGENTAEQKYKLEKGKEFSIKTERFEYETSTPTREKIIFYNNDDKAYKEVFISYDALGNKTEEESIFKLTSNRSITTYIYDDYGRIKEITEIVIMMGKNETIYRFNYDTNGNLEEIKVAKDGKAYEVIQFIYQAESFLLKAMLRKEELTGIIYIAQYDYAFKEDKSVKID